MRKLTVTVLLLLVLLGLALTASAHTAAHQHQWSTHGIVGDGLLVGHDSTIICINGSLNFDTKYERHRHYEKKNSTDVWRLTTHYYDAIRYGPAYNICG